MSIFAKIRRRLGRHKKEEVNLPIVEVRERTEGQMETLGKAVIVFIDTLKELEELYPCSCGNLFLCRHKTCPQCGAVNPKYKEFTDEDQWRAEGKVRTALKEIHDVRKTL